MQLLNPILARIALSFMTRVQRYVCAAIGGMNALAEQGGQAPVTPPNIHQRDAQGALAPTSCLPDTHMRRQSPPGWPTHACGASTRASTTRSTSC
jgi:hypothetical protein